MRRIDILRTGLIAGAVSLGLGFGVVEALAAPGAPAAAEAACSALWAAKCNQLCIDRGYDSGTCDAATGQCLCWQSPVD